MHVSPSAVENAIRLLDSAAVPMSRGKHRGSQPPLSAAVALGGMTTLGACDIDFETLLLRPHNIHMVSSGPQTAIKLGH